MCNSMQVITGSPNLEYTTGEGTRLYVESGAAHTIDRVREYNFGFITSTAGSLLIGSTIYPINGEVLRMVYTAANFTTGGSIWLQNTVNSAVENIGSVAGNLNTSQIVYPAKALQNGTGASRVAVNGHVIYSGIGVGGPLSGQLSIFYR